MHHQWSPGHSRSSRSRKLAVNSTRHSGSATAYVIRLPVHPLARVEEGVATETTGQVTTDVTTELRRLAAAFRGSEEFTRQELQDALALKNAEHFRKAYLLPALASGMVEMTLPDMPRSSKQRYRLTADASQWLAKQREGN